MKRDPAHQEGLSIVDQYVEFALPSLYNDITLLFYCPPSRPETRHEKVA